MLEVPVRVGNADHRNVQDTSLRHRVKGGEDLLAGEVPGRAEEHERVGPVCAIVALAHLSLLRSSPNDQVRQPPLQRAGRPTGPGSFAPRSIATTRVQHYTGDHKALPYFDPRVMLVPPDPNVTSRHASHPLGVSGRPIIGRPEQTSRRGYMASRCSAQSRAPRRAPRQNRARSRAQRRSARGGIRAHPPGGRHAAARRIIGRPTADPGGRGVCGDG